MAKKPTARSAAKPGTDPVVLRPLLKSAPMALLRCREAFMQKFRPMLHRHGVTEQQWRVLRVLMENDSIEVTRLAEAAVILPPSLSRILRNMESDGLIRRRTVRDDQRRSQISTTVRARRLFQKVARESDAIYRELEQALGGKRLDQLDALLTTMERELQALDLGD